MDLDKIEKRANAATEGPWKRSAEEDDTPVVYHDHPAVAGAAEVIFVADRGTEADAEFAAHARTDVPALVARVRELEEENQKLREAEKRIRFLHYIDPVNGYEDECMECEHGTPCQTIQALDRARDITKGARTDG